MSDFSLPVAKLSALLIAWGCSALLIETNYFLDGTAGFAPAEIRLRKLASNQVGSWGASLPSSLQDSPWKATAPVRSPVSWWAARWQGGWQKKPLQDSLVYLSPNLASASNPDESTH